MSKKDDYIKVTSSEKMALEVRKSRRRQELSAEKLAQFANLSRYAVMNFENQKKDIRLSTLLKILSLCNIEIYIKVKK